MADEWTLPHEPAFAVPDDDDDDDDDFRVTEYRPRPANRDSASTSKSRRESYYDAQRGPDAPARRSRPTSTASEWTTRSRAKQRASYPDPIDNDNRDETAYPHPVPSQDTRQTRDDGRGGDQPPTQADGAGAGAGMHVRNFSRISARRKTRESDGEALNVADVSAVPPIPQSNRWSAATTARPTTHPAKGSDDRGNEPDNAGLPRPRSQTPPGDNSTAMEAAPDWLTELYTISYLVFFAIFGTLARLGVQWLAFYPGAPVTTPVIWANMAGSWIMGFLSEDQTLFRDHARRTLQQTDKDKSDQETSTLARTELNKRKKAIPLYIGLATGFCGSFTSFSSFARDVFLALSNDLPAPVYHSASLAAGDSPASSIIGRHAGYSFEALFGVILSTLALSIGGYGVGAHTALALDSFTPALPATFIRKVLDPLFVVLACGCWAAAVILAALPPDRSWRGEVLFALVFAPVGALARFYASRHMNALIAWFPLGTFAVNMFGTAIEAMCYDIQHVPISSLRGAIGGGPLGCQVLQGVQDGFCGCLTTVSTWVAELAGLKRRHGYFYAAASVGGALALMVVITGSVRWSVGFHEPVCGTGYTSKLGA